MTELTLAGMVLVALTLLVIALTSETTDDSSVVEVSLDKEEQHRRELARFAQEWADKHPPIPLDEIEKRNKENK